MSDKAEKKKEGPAKDAAKDAKDGHGAEAKKKGGIGALLTKLPVILGSAMVLEAAVLVAGFKMMGGGPKSADASVSLETPADHGEETAGAEHGAPAAEGHEASSEHGAAPAAEHGAAAPAATGSPKKPVEVQIVEFRAPNKQGGRTFLYDVSIFAVTKNANKSKVQSAIKDSEALIKDRVRTIIAQSDPEKLGGGSEPGLETLRRQVKYQLEQIVGEGIIDEVLIPRCTPFRTDF